MTKKKKITGTLRPSVILTPEQRQELDKVKELTALKADSKAIQRCINSYADHVEQIMLLRNKLNAAATELFDYRNKVEILRDGFNWIINEPKKKK